MEPPATRARGAWAWAGEAGAAPGAPRPEQRRNVSRGRRGGAGVRERRDGAAGGPRRGGSRAPAAAAARDPGQQRSQALGPQAGPGGAYRRHRLQRLHPAR